MQWEFKELWRNLVEWVNSIGFPLEILGVVLAVLAIVVSIGLHFSARKQSRKNHTHILRALNSQKADHAFKSPKSAEAAELEEAVKKVGQSPHASPIDKAIADAYSLQKAGETEKAIEQWRSIAHLMEGVDNRIAARAWFSVGYLLSLSKNPIKEISAYDQAIRLDPGNSAAYNNRGSVKAELKQNEEAIEDFDRAIRLNPNHSVAYYNRGNAKVSLEQYEEAIKDYDQAIRLNPKYSAAYYNRGNAKVGLEQHEAAIQDYNEAIHLNPKYSDAYYNRGLAKAHLQQYEAAIQDCNEAIRLNPEDSAAYCNRGLAKASMQQYEAAIQDFNEAIRLNPKYSVAYYNRGLAKPQLGRIDEARSDLQTALRLAKEEGNEKLVATIIDALHALRQIDHPETK